MNASSALNIFEVPVHPLANVFPMLAEDELAELADDIAENGLREPLVLQEIDGQVLLVDGRNRRAACKLLEIVPEITWLNGQDARDYIISTNIMRRHLTAGQRAMAYAMLYPEGKIGRPKNGEKLHTECEVSINYLSRARYVLKHTDLSSKVMAGLSLNAAYEQAKQRDMDREAWDAALAEIRSLAPDLYEKVMAGEMTPFKAKDEYKARVEKDRVDRLGLWGALKNLDMFSSVFTERSYERYETYLIHHRDECDTDLIKLKRQLKDVIDFLKPDLIRGK